MSSSAQAYEHMSHVMRIPAFCIFENKGTDQLRRESLIHAHALINAHLPIWTLKMTIFFTLFSKLPASYKRPLQNNGTK